MIFSTNQISSQHFIRQVYNSETIYREAQNSETIYREAQNSVKVEQIVYNFDYASLKKWNEQFNSWYYFDVLPLTLY